MRFHALDFLFYLSYQATPYGPGPGKVIRVIDGIMGLVIWTFLSSLFFGKHLMEHTVSPLFQSHYMFCFNMALLMFVILFIYYWRKDRWRFVTEHYDELYGNCRWIIVIGGLIAYYVVPVFVMFLWINWETVCQFVSQIFTRVISH